jgi:hypothetical protein
MECPDSLDPQEVRTDGAAGVNADGNQASEAR